MASEREHVNAQGRGARERLARRPASPAPELPAAFRPTALVLRERLSFEEWVNVGRDVLRPMARGVQWWIGDWLCYGEHRYGEKYAQACDVTGYSYQTLANMQFVAAAVEPSRRRENLPWAHHSEVAALPPNEQRRWLARAEREGLSRAELRAALRDAKALPPPSSVDTARCPACGGRLVCVRCDGAATVAAGDAAAAPRVEP